MLPFLLRKEFRLIFRDKTILAMMFAMPIFQLIIMPLAADFEVSEVNIAYVDNDHSPYSTQLIHQIESSGYFNTIATPASHQEALQLLEHGTIDVLLEIPPQFEQNLIHQKHQQLYLAADAINGTKAALGSAYLASVIRQFNQEIDIISKSPQAARQPTAQLGLENVNWYNPLSNYHYNIVPGILVLLLTLVGGFISALNIVREKEAGTMEQINVTPIKKWQFILGKLIPFWLIGLVVFTLGLAVMYIVYGIFPAGSLALLYLFAALYLIALLGFGLLISTFANTQLQAMFIAFFFIMIFILMSGLFTSTASMPRWAYLISQCIPITHFMEVVRLIVLKGAQFIDLLLPFAYLVGFALLLNTAAICNYRKTN